MDEFAKGGISSLETTASLRTHPSASLTRSCGGRHAHRESTQRWASASGITPARRWFPSASSCRLGQAFVIALHPFRAARPCLAFQIGTVRSMARCSAQRRRKPLLCVERKPDHDGHLTDGEDPDGAAGPGDPTQATASGRRRPHRPSSARRTPGTPRTRGS